MSDQLNPQPVKDKYVLGPRKAITIFGGYPVREIVHAETGKKVATITFSQGNWEEELGRLLSALNDEE